MPRPFMQFVAAALFVATIAAAVAVVMDSGGDPESVPTSISDFGSGQDRPTLHPIDGSNTGSNSQNGDQPSTPPTQNETEADPPSAPAEPADADPDDEESSPANATNHTVQSGDSLADIADRFDTTVEALLALNNLSDPSALAVGQVLLLPGAEEKSVTPAAPTPTPTSPDTGQGTDPGTIPQPGPDEVVTDIPDRPDAFRDYGAAALPWLHTRTQVDEIIPLFEEWGMPPVPGECCRLNLIDTDLDGLFSVVIIYTDPRTFSDPIGVGTYLVIYDPIPERPDRYRIAYDHIIRTGRSSLGIQVFDRGDVTSDGQRDVVYIEELCGASTCTTTDHVLVRDGSGYREIADSPI